PKLTHQTYHLPDSINSPILIIPYPLLFKMTSAAWNPFVLTRHLADQCEPAAINGSWRKKKYQPCQSKQTTAIRNYRTKKSTAGSSLPLQDHSWPLASVD